MISYRHADILKNIPAKDTAKGTKYYFNVDWSPEGLVIGRISRHDDFRKPLEEDIEPINDVIKEFASKHDSKVANDMTHSHVIIAKNREDVLRLIKEFVYAFKSHGFHIYVHHSEYHENMWGFYPKEKE